MVLGPWDLAAGRGYKSERTRGDHKNFQVEHGTETGRMGHIVVLVTVL